MRIFIFVLLINRLLGETGLQKAKELIKQPISSPKPIKDVILSGIVDQLKEHGYKLQILRMRVGQAWEWVFTDYGFKKQPSGIDLINHRRKIVIELKNGYRINSMVKREDLRRLQEFKSQHPRYTVILGFINDKTSEGKSKIKNGVHIMSGKRFLQHIFKGNEVNIIRNLRRAVQTVI